MFFYAIFAISLLFSSRVRIAFIAALLILLVFIGQSIRGIDDYGVVAFTLSRPILLDFLLGVLIACYFRYPLRSDATWKWWLSLTAGFLWFIFGGAVFDFANPISPPTDTFLRFGIPSGMIAAGMIGLESSGMALRSRFMQLCGDASYSIYLSHYLTVGAAMLLSNRLQFEDLARTLFALATMAAAVATGIATYYLVERPLAGDRSAYSNLRALALGPRVSPRRTG